MKSANFRVKFDTRADRDLRKLNQKVPGIIPPLIKIIDSLKRQFILSALAIVKKSTVR